ncbi:MAG: hypothetical protein GY697_04420, partial [Desulfobacterales bacterium]|nr:hypothetical protein [Desulfobacterales bacterium]
MAAKQGHACRRLGLEMEIRLRAGIPLCRDTLAFMASTFSIESPRDLRIVLADPDDSDTQSLLELLFTPDETTRIDLENIIERSSCTDEDEQVVIHDLFHKNIKVPISFPGAEDRLIYNPTRHHLKTWVRGLKITTHLP